MLSWDIKNTPLCKLPQREIKPSESACFKTHPIIDIAVEISSAPRLCNTVSLSSINSEKSCQSQGNKLKKLSARYIERYYNKLKSFRILSECLNIIPEALLQLKRFILSEEPNSIEINDFVETRSWTTSSIRSIAWHPHVFKLAIACSDDVIRVYNESGKQPPRLKHKSQKLITCLAWRPFAIDELAVGCSNGIIFWFRETSEEHIMHEKLLTNGNHYPVTALEWRIDGLLLATVSINDSSILLWNVETGYCTALKRFHLKCCSIKWAPETENLFCATVERVFGVLNMESTCSIERFSLKSGYVQSAVWSPCGEVLLFVTSNDARLYRFQQIGSSPFLSVKKAWKAIPVVDLTPICVENNFIGGLPQAVIWDQSGTFAAVNFKQTNSIAVFITKIDGENFFITPYGYILGHDELYPVFVCFQSCNVFNENVVLTIGWSDGFVEFRLLKKT